MTSQSPFSRLGKHIGDSSVAIGSALTWGYFLMLFVHDIEYITTDKRENVYFSVL